MRQHLRVRLDRTYFPEIDSIFNSLHLSSSQKKKKIAFKSLQTLNIPLNILQTFLEIK